MWHSCMCHNYNVIIPERVLYGKGVVSVGIVTIIVALSAVLGSQII